MSSPVLAFLVRAAGEFRRGGYVFTGFHWPVLAARLAARLPGEPFCQVLEAGATCHDPSPVVPTSTTDYPAYADVLAWRGSTAEVLFTLVRRCHRVVLDAANVDMLGRVNATAIGPYHRPRVRLAGGGGAADAAAAARELVLLHGGVDPGRLVSQVDQVTAAPPPGVPVTLHTRWGVLALGERPALLERGPAAGRDGFLDRLAALGVDTTGARPAAEPTVDELAAARAVLAEAAGRGYRVALAALAELAAPGWPPATREAAGGG
jgi:glutaconate CoA-transferase subunit B